MKSFLIACAALLLASCQDAPSTYSPAPMTFSGQALRLNVAQVRIVENYKSPMHAPNVDHEFPQPPSEALKQWVNQRIQAVGSQGVFEVTIDDASVKEVKLPKTQGVKGLFTDDQDARYEARIMVTMKLFDGTNAISVASGDVVLSRSKTINEKATVNDRTRMLDKMQKDMLNAFDTQAQARLHQFFAAYLR